MVRTMCGVKLLEKKRTEELTGMLGPEERIITLAKTNGVRWYKHVLRKDKGHVLNEARIRGRSSN